MNLRKCPNNHYYNVDKFPYCPHCITATGNPENDSSQIDIPTEHRNPPSAGSKPFSEHLTVGWLICLSGSNRGLSYPIYPGANHIGRNANMNIRLKDEATISRTDHAIVFYDKDTQTFSLTANTASNPVRVNDILLDSETLLTDRDLIQLGECQMLFVCLCDKRFHW